MGFILQEVSKNQHMIKCLNFHKVNQFDIPPKSFIFEGKDYDVPCVWMG